MPDNAISVWECPLGPDSVIKEELLDVLNDDELARADKYRFEKDRTHFIWRRSILRKLIARHLDGVPPGKVEIAYGPFGKPYLPGQSHLHFNVSHSEHFAVMAFADGPLGIDIEVPKVGLKFNQIADHFFSPRESVQLTGLDPEITATAFYNCWTRKEAFIKARGDGLTFPLNKFEVSLLPGEPVKFIGIDHPEERVEDWSLQALSNTDDYVGALAFKGPEKEVQYHVWETERL